MKGIENNNNEDNELLIFNKSLPRGMNDSVISNDNEDADIASNYEAPDNTAINENEALEQSERDQVCHRRPRRENMGVPLDFF